MAHPDDDVSPVSRSPRALSPTTTKTVFSSSSLRAAEQASNTVGHEDSPSPSPAKNQVHLLPSIEFGSAVPHNASPAIHTTAANHDSESSPISVSRKRPGMKGTSTPPERKSVQFARGTTEELGPTPLAKTTTWETDDEHNERDRQGSGSFLTKLKAMSNHVRSSSSATMPHPSRPTLSPQSERSDPMLPIPAEAVEEDIDADEEDSSDDQVIGSDVRPKRRRRGKRPITGGPESLPTTPKASRFASFIRDRPIPGTSSSRPATLRRSTFSDAEDNARAGVSEDEGKDRIRNAWRRGIEGARGLSYAARRDKEGEPSEPRRPGNLRRLTGFGGPDTSSSPFRQRADRHNSASVQKWRQVKAGLRMLGQRQKNERTKIDHQKSAQLMAELLAGAPAALMFASMFQRDEHHRQKVPVLLEQLKIAIPDVQTRTDKKGDRDYIYRVDLEYGNGPARMNWTIHRSVNDFVNLHVKYKTEETLHRARHLRSDDKSKPKIPRFPKSVIPYARSMRGLFEKLGDEEDEVDGNEGSGTLDGVAAGSSASATKRPKGHKRRLSSFAPPTRQSTNEIGNTPADLDALTTRQRQLYAERSRQKLETYLQQMIRWLIFRPESTRLCKFLEVSAMAVRLSAENGYQGKQGLLQIASRRQRGNQGLRRKTLQTFGPYKFKERHKRRWFLVRHSYIVCVDGPESLNPYDVFLVDSDFSIEEPRKKILDQKTPQDMARIATENAAPTKRAHIIRMANSERKFKLYARNEKQYLQFQESLNHMMDSTIWSKKQRFASFAPVRNNVWARWLVDGRDHMWQVSRAIDNAKDLIYIHDWWLSPELYMRRPAAISQKWRLDRLLQRKANEGVKIFVIVYRNIESAIPIDSEYTKWSLLDLHENICVQRSPNQFRQNQFFWAHHEKLVVVDNMMAFVGGVDLCFGRWDDPCHTLTDDKLTGFELHHDLPRDSEHCQMWPGKDYSNPRVQDFYALDKPYEEMYDRTKVPRMPWHDISMQMVGQPARDVGRHFVQRWNYILRSRVPSRPTPVLMPPPEYDHSELERLGMTGTCQIQILRSCAPWSIGTPHKVEHSIMTAYCALIKTSEHFVYIENQFFITSCTMEGTTIHNKIGDAIVERAIEAHDKGQKWQICIIIPLMPGFQNSVDAQDGTSVRLIMQCQYRSINRGERSIFGRLRARGIRPEEYVRFYSLRKWGKIGPRKCLTTEQLYIHAKCMIVDDRHVIIGSANINERSMLGSRDSEVASVVTDTCMIPSFMAGKPYDVGEFPHTLRKRLMREHLGVDVDAIYRREQAVAEQEQNAEMDRIFRDDDHFTPTREYFETLPHTPTPNIVHHNTLEGTIGNPARGKEEPNGWGDNTQSSSSSSDNTETHDPNKEFKKSAERDLDVEGHGFDNMKRLVDAGDDGLRDSFVDSQGREVLLKKDAPDAARIQLISEREASRQRSESRERKQAPPVRPPWPTDRLDTIQLGLPTRSLLPELPALDDTDIGGPSLRRANTDVSKKGVDPLLRSMRQPDVNEDCMTDPIATSFYNDIWHQVADNNTKIFRQVFRCMPDSEATDWRTYNQYNEYNEAFMQAQGLGKATVRAQGAPDKSGPPGAGGTNPSSPVDGSFPDMKNKSRGLLGGLVDKLRPSSRANDALDADGVNEKDAQQGKAPGSPGSGASSVPTMVPSPNQEPLNEKDANDQNETIDQSEAARQNGTSLNEKGTQQLEDNSVDRTRTLPASDTPTLSETTAIQSHSTPSVTLQHTNSQKRRRRAATKSSARPIAAEDILDSEEAEDLLNLVQGHLVLFPYDWLEKEERGSNWLYTVDTLAPIEIYD